MDGSAWRASDAESCPVHSVSQTSRWIPVKLAFVQYPEGDMVGHLLAWFSLAPVLLLAASTGLLLFRREIQMFVFLFGLGLNEAINLVAKKVIKQPRPCSQHDMTLQHSELGMPSSHAQFIWFFCFYLSLFVTLRVPHLPFAGSGASSVYIFSNNSSPPNGGNSNNSGYPCAAAAYSLSGHFLCWWKNLINLSLGVLAILVSYSRVYLEYHTWSQITVGAIAGIVVSSVWYAITVWYLVPRYPSLVSNTVAEFFMLRDSSLIPNVIVFEYVKSRSESQARLRKLQTES